jgi:RNA polymerase sigma-70 factor (ECF subfamily)
MAHQSTFASLSDFSTQHAHLIEVFYAEAQGARWGLSRERFAESLHRSAEKRFHNRRGNASEVETYLKSLHLEDLALACACSDGIEAAWEFFVAHFRQDLRSASRAILRSSGSGNDVRAEELADSLYAELYGIRSTGGGRRKSLFEYFHGRSKLSTWLRAVLAQRHVDLLRTDHGTISLDSGHGGRHDGRLEGRRDMPALELQVATDAAPADPDRAKYLARLDRALLAAFAYLAPRERMLLTCYYVDQLTLAEIGRTLGDHESTVSRQLERTRRALRETVTDLLRRGAPPQDGHGGDAGLDVAQVELTFEYALEDWPFDLSRALSNVESAADPPDQ